MTERAFQLGYRRPQPKDSSFTGNVTKARRERGMAFMEADLAKSGLVDMDIHSDADLYNAEEAVDSAYLIPYNYLDGTPIKDGEGFSGMWRTRIDWSPRPVRDGFKKGKYTQPSKKMVGQELANAPYVPWGMNIEAGGDVLYICEGEKKTACVVKHLGVKAIGIGGKDQWRVSEDEDTKLHPWIAKAVALYERVVIVPDGDITRWDIAKSYGYLEALVEKLVPVTTLDPADKIDDLIVAWQADGLDIAEQFEAIPELKHRKEDPKYLINEYGLSSEKVRGAMRIEIQEDNVKRLLLRHPSIPNIWLNQDHNKVYFNDQVALERDVHYLFSHFIRGMDMTKLKRHMFMDCIAVVADINARSPWRDSLSELEWDGVPRVGTMFQDYCASESPADYLKMVAERWLVGSIARQFEPGVAVDFMVIAKGPQGVGKSWFPRILWEDELVVDIIGVEGQQKDQLSKMHRGVVAAFEELAGMNKKELESLKAIVTTRNDVFRPPYGRVDTDHPRRFVMYGSTNDVAPLKNDPSGYRRWAVVEFGQVDWDKLKVDRSQLWAEAMHLYRAGVEYRMLDTALMGHIAEYAMSDPIVEKLEGCIAEGTWFNSYYVDGFFEVQMKDICDVLDIPYSAGTANPAQRSVRAYLAATPSVVKKSRGSTGKRNVWLIPSPKGFEPRVGNF